MEHNNQQSTLSEIIQYFIEQSLKAETLTQEYYKNKKYNGYKIKPSSFGQNLKSFVKVTSLAILGEHQTIKQGIYPCILIYRKYEIDDNNTWRESKGTIDKCPLVVSYGISESVAPSANWDNLNMKTIKERSGIENIKYGESYVEEVYNVSINNIPLDDITTSLDNVIKKYQEVIPSNINCSPKETTRSISQNNTPKLMVGETDIIAILRTNQNIILHGAPGTGKTYLAKEIAKAMCGNVEDFKKLEDSGRFKMVQFHPSYDYTDFVEGLRPTDRDSKGNKLDTMQFVRKNGVFKEFCKEADNAKEENFIFLIDEINRGDMSKIFGELFYAIDPGYRGEDGKIDTQYQNLVAAQYKDENGVLHDDPFHKGFYVPDNVYIIGTMNDIDRSVESMDFAMRRRFQFIEVTAESRACGMGLKKDENTEADYKTKDAYARMTNLNKCIISKEIGLSKAYQIGGSYFLKKVDEGGKKVSKPIEDKSEFDNLWKYKLEGLLREYLRGEEDKVIEKKLEKILKPAFDCENDHIYNEKGELDKTKNNNTDVKESGTTTETDQESSESPNE